MQDTRAVSERAVSRRAFTAAAAAFATIAFVRAPARAAAITWKCGNESPADIPLNLRLSEAFAKIRAETNGQLDIQNYPASALGSGASMISQLRLGALEMMAQAGGQFDSLVPLAAVENMPFAFPNYETAWRAFDGELGNLVRSALSAEGFYIFDKVYDSGFRQFTTSTKPIANVDDLRGMKIRVPASKFRVDAFRSLGASPTPISYNEIYTALQTHVIDGQEGPLVFIDGQKFYEVQKYCSISNHMWGTFYVLVNREHWDGLPRKFQDVMKKHINGAAMLQRRDDERLDETLVAKLTARGMVFNKADAASFRARLKSSGFYARWKQAWGPKLWDALEKYSGPLA
ncbi:MAG TPA: TRAP transporter substrate-binding protein [Candidatus Elarobacter sp.]|nr:TRAP transporter substrate-binding protein [Candidatus Elarobacter sp.]